MSDNQSSWARFKLVLGGIVTLGVVLFVLTHLHFILLLSLGSNLVLGGAVVMLNSSRKAAKQELRELKNPSPPSLSDGLDPLL